MKSATARSAKDPAGRCRTPASPRAQRGRGLPYLQAVGAWRRRLLVRLKEDLLAPPEELDNSDEDMVQHQDHARSRPPARPPAPPLRWVSASAIASLSPRDCPPGPRPGPPTPRPTATEPRPLPRNPGQHLSASPIFGLHQIPHQISPPLSLRSQVFHLVRY